MSRSASVDSATRGFRPDVEGMRALAIVLVVAYHGGWSVVSGGFIGVDVFFVLSGFLITGLLSDELRREGSVDFARFYGRRIRRLLPMATLVLITVAVVFSAVISPLDRHSLLEDIEAAAAYFANWHYAHGALDYLHDPSTSPVLHFWSLSVEEQFYLVWPVLLVAVAGVRGRHRQGDRRTSMLVALACVAAGS